MAANVSVKATTRAPREPASVRLTAAEKSRTRADTDRCSSTPPLSSSPPFAQSRRDTIVTVPRVGEEPARPRHRGEWPRWLRCVMRRAGRTSYRRDHGRGDRGARTDEALRRHARRRRVVVLRPGRPRDRLRRTQRRGEVDHDADGAGSGRARRRRGPCQRPPLRSGDPSAARRGRPLGGGCHPPGSARPRPPALAGPQQRPAPPARRRGPRPRRPRTGRRPTHRRVLARHDPTARDRRGHARRPARPHVRRAGQRPRPRGHPMDPRVPALPRRRGPGGVRVESPHERAGGHRRPRDRDRSRPSDRRRARRRSAGGGVGRPHHREDAAARRGHRRVDRCRRHGHVERRRRAGGDRTARRTGGIARRRSRARAPRPGAAPRHPRGRLHRADARDGRVPDPSAGRRSVMSSRALNAEWTKFRSVRSTAWTSLIAVAVTVGLTFLVTNGASTDATMAGPGDDDVVAMSLVGIYVGQFAIIALAVLVATAEYATGQIRATFAAVPRRHRVIVAKAAVVGGASLAVGGVATVTSFLVAQPVLRGNGYVAPAYPPPSLTDPTVLRAVLGAALLLALLALFGLGVGAIARRTAGAISVVLGLVLLAPILADSLPENVSRWMTRLTPSAGFAVMETRPRPDAVIGPWAGLAVTAAYAVAALAAAIWLTARRDV